MSGLNEATLPPRKKMERNFNKRVWATLLTTLYPPPRPPPPPPQSMVNLCVVWLLKLFSSVYLNGNMQKNFHTFCEFKSL